MLPQTSFGQKNQTQTQTAPPQVEPVVVGGDCLCPGEYAQLVADYVWQDSALYGFAENATCYDIEQLLAAGAFDAWITPIIMKKGRPAFTVRALCDPARLEIVRSTMVTHTGSLGIRASEVRRWPQQRAEQVVVVDGHSIRVKVAAHRVKVEFGDAQAAARALGVPVRDIIAAAERLSQP